MPADLHPSSGLAMDGDSEDPSVTVFYNYHSIPLPSQAIESLLKFVTSQLSVVILQFSFCCDVRFTPPDVLNKVEKLPDCEIVHIGQQMDIGEQISKKILRQAEDKMMTILISDQANYTLLFENSELGESVIFYPPEAEESFYGQADRAIQLPVKMEETASVAVIPATIKLKSSQVDLNDLNSRLTEFGKRAANMIEKIEAIKEEMKNHRKLTQWIDDQTGAVEDEDDEDKEKWTKTPLEPKPPMRPGRGANPFETKNPFENNTANYKQNYPASHHSEAQSVNHFQGRAFGGGMKNPFDNGRTLSSLHERFKKPAPQCPQWKNAEHREAGDCALWHPHKPCVFFPMCWMMAANCGYSHPFCSDEECQCEGVRDPQMNHFILVAVDTQ